MRRTRLSLFGLAALSVVLLCGCAPSAGPKPPSASLGALLDQRLPAAVLRLPFTDTVGATTTLAQFAGRVIVLSDVMTLCQETCPLDTANLVTLAAAVDRAGLSSKVEFVSITIDPTRDTVAQLAAYRALYRPPPNWLVLTGTAASINTLWTTLGVWRQQVPDDADPPTNWLTHVPLTYDIDHSDDVFFFDAAQHKRFEFDGPAEVNSAAAIPATLNTFMDAEGHHNVTSPAAGSWTPAQGRQVLSWLLGRRVPQ